MYYQEYNPVALHCTSSSNILVAPNQQVIKTKVNWGQRDQERIKIDKRNIKPDSLNFLYPIQHNTSNIFALLETNNDNKDDDKTTIISNQTLDTMETSHSTSIMKITNKEDIADARAMGIFSLPETPVNNLQP